MGDESNMTYLTKKIFASIFLLAGSSFVLLQLYKVSRLCTVEGTTYYSCLDIAANVKIISFYLTLLLLPLVFLIPFRHSLFETWKRFAVFTIPPILVATYFIGQMSSGGGVGVVGYHPGLVYIPLLYGAYFLISIGIIMYAIIRERRVGRKSP